jgi:hypothetical protein
MGKKAQTPYQPYQRMSDMADTPYDTLKTALAAADWHRMASASTGLCVYETWMQRGGRKRLVIEHDDEGFLDVYFIEPSNSLQPALYYISGV